MQLLPERAEMRSLLQLAVPLVTVQIGQMLLGVVDTMMVGHLSAVALAAVAIGNLFYFALTVLGMGVLSALDAIIAQAVGARDEIGIARGLQRGFVLAVVATIVLSSAMPFAGPVLRALHQPAELIPLAARYILIVMPSTLPVLGYLVLRQTLQAMGRVRPVVVTIVAANLCNAFLNWVLIFGNLGAPPLGVVGSAWATTISRFGMFLALLAMTYPVLRPYLKPRRDAVAAVPLLRMLRIGMPVGLGQFFEFANFAGIALLMGLLGTTQVAAHQVAINIASLTFMVPAGIATAAAVLVGSSIGAEDQSGAYRYAHASLVLAVAFMSCSALLMLTAPRLLAGFYTNDDAVLGLAAVLLPIAGVFQVFDGMQVVGAGVLRGTGDTRVPMIIAIGGFWIVGMPISIYFGLFTAAGAAGLWWGFVAGLAAVALALLLRIRARFSGELRRILFDDHHVVEMET